MVALLSLLKALPRNMNPSTAEQLKKAASIYESFHWGEPMDRVRRKRMSPIPKVAVKLGKLNSLVYETSKAGEKAEWEHSFGEEGGKRPDLVMDAKTNKLHIVGGDYRIEKEGIKN